MTKTFYKIENGQAQVGSGTFIPTEFIEYQVGQEPVELTEALNKENAIQDLTRRIAEANDYLNSTDFYYPRFLETGKSVPEEVVLKRTEAREFIRLNKVVV